MSEADNVAGSVIVVWELSAVARLAIVVFAAGVVIIFAWTFLPALGSEEEHADSANFVKVSSKPDGITQDNDSSEQSFMLLSKSTKISKSLSRNCFAYHHLRVILLILAQCSVTM